MGRPSWAPMAQSQISALVGGWTQPVNLSHSGSASNPQLIIDATGRFHAIWLDAYNGYMDSDSSDGKVWSKPVPVSFPFGFKDAPPLLRSDSKGLIHALWKDARNALLYSRVPSAGFSTGTAWAAPVNLAVSVVGFDAAVDQTGTIHLAYVSASLQTPITGTVPSGVYYRQSTDSGFRWSPLQTLYQSPYLRSITADQANVKVTPSSDGSAVYAVWDNRQLKRIVFSRSIDGGKSWIDPIALKQPAADLSSAAPYNGNLVVNGNDVLFIWLTGTPGATCTLNGQWSKDQGASWSQSVPVFRNSSGCPQGNRFAWANDQSVVVTANLDGQILLAAWNGSQWSNPQRVLSSFTDPDTFNPVALSCQTVLTGVGGQLFTIGCDQVGGDIWLSSRPPYLAEDWFPAASKWSTPGIIATGSSEISSASLMADSAEGLNAFWIQTYQSNNVISSTISYAKWNGQTWAQPVAVIAVPQGEINGLDTATDGQRLLTVWSEGLTGQIYFSWANLGRAQIPSEWAQPKQLVPNHTTETNPKLMVDSSGAIFVAYAVPINENRGVYLVKSLDRGANWSNPVRVFDAAAAGWNMTAAPQLVESGGGLWNAIWMKYPLPGSRGPIGLYASQSRDSGLTWLDWPEVVEGSITWSALAGKSGATLHRLWQMSSGKERIVWHQFSNDAATSWSLPASITGLGAYVGAPAVAVDIGGRLHLFQARLSSSHSEDVLYWFWDQGSWSSGDSLEIGDNNGFAVDYLAAAVSPSGKLVVLYPGLVNDANSGSPVNALYYSSRSVDIPSVTPTPQVQPTALATITPQPTFTAISSPISTAVVPSTGPDNGIAAGPAATNNPWMGVILGGGLVAALIAVFFAYRLLTYRQQ
jgi:hypothetical protein